MNLESDGLWNYVYDAENRLVQMTPTSAALNAGHPDRTLNFKYDYLGRRVMKHDTGPGYSTYRRYLYDGWDLVAEFDATETICGSLVRSYTWGLDLAGSLTATGGIGALVQITDHASNLSFFPTYDGNGNVASLVQAATGGGVAAGTTVARYEYSPFGETLRAEVLGSLNVAVAAVIASQPFRFSTKFTDVETGLIYYGARFFSPAVGRFINRDLFEEAGGLNLYGFCGNDGVNVVDFLGLDASDPKKPDNKEKDDVVVLDSVVVSAGGLSAALGFPGGGFRGGRLANATDVGLPKQIIVIPPDPIEGTIAATLIMVPTSWRT